MKVSDLISLVDSRFPLSKALEWDNCGLQVGDPGCEVKGILVSLDVSLEVVEEAVRNGCNVVVSHHPLIFRGVKRIDLSENLGSIIRACIVNKLSILSFHTNVDVAEGGLADEVCSLLGLNVISSLCEDGIGRICEADFGSIEELVERVRSSLGIPHPLAVVRGRPSAIRRVAVCPGSGGDLISRVVELGVDCFITGDVKYHQAQVASGRVWVVDATHYFTERPFISLMGRFLGEAGLRVIASKVDGNPFSYMGGE